MSRSHVSLEQRICAVCGQPFDTNNLLMDKRLRQSLEYKTITGYGMCPEHQKLKDDGYVALVEIDPAKSGIGEDTEAIKLPGAYRTGNLAHVRASVFSDLFDVPLPEDMLVFVEPGLIDTLKTKAPPEASDG